MPVPDTDRIGSRIKEQRRLARLTQRQLADRIPFSYSLLNQVECGARPATPELVDAVATALRIDAAVLTGGEPREPRTGRVDVAKLLTPIRESLDYYDLGPNEDLLEVRPVGALISAAEQVCRTVRATHLRAAAEDLPGLIVELTHIIWTSPTTEAWQALASSYRTAHDVALKLGYLDLARVALDRMGWAASHASTPCLAAVQRYKRAILLRSPASLRLLVTGQQLLDGLSSREALAVSGQLHLGATAVAARSGDQTGVADHIAAAEELVGRLGGGAPEIHQLSFGRTNVALHELGASITMRRYDDALVQARKLRMPASAATSRRARYLVDRALVEMEAGHSEASLRFLVQARHAAPEQTRHLPGTRITVRGLVHTSRRSSETLTGMARWIGL
ncbi:helix-turn-helix domain-containing protein [Streptomyces lichenis]|uniref:Helix-turn-helix domain-containing protein n=1 Tax=Streptomyces lichenis TaxID=2306967 RepID=A0ABT0IFR9_9ACTN|nr:helix-turn-helix transcriptional regulator [Streptomyces lichenis]MCK8680164.1 helix-turn-helix domain-containing protein [Streptomyces lichenis]